MKFSGQFTAAESLDLKWSPVAAPLNLRPVSFVVALDVSRLIWRSWGGKLPTGIDRVCIAYLRHYRSVALAVVQHRGVRRILTPQHSEKLFDLLLGPEEAFRRGITALAPKALLASSHHQDCEGAFYINIGHTDIDVPGLAEWTMACNLRPIYMIHDLIPLTHSEFCTARAVARHRARVHGALAHATGIIANSRSTATDLRRYASERGLTLPPMCAAWLAGAGLQALGAASGKPSHYFVYVSTIEGRKNHFMLLQVWRRLVERMGARAPHLVIIGQMGAQSDHVMTMIQQCSVIASHVQVLSACADGDLGHWVAGARAVLFPSFAEGFGLPVVEALQMGTPVIASDLPCFREIGQGIPTLLDPLDARGWEAAITAFSGDCAERTRQMALLQDYVAPSWGSHFARVDRWLNQLCEGALAQAEEYRPAAQVPIPLESV